MENFTTIKNITSFSDAWRVNFATELIQSARQKKEQRLSCPGQYSLLHNMKRAFSPITKFPSSY